MHRYAIAFGSNRRHGAHGAPADVIAAALAVLGDEMRIVAASPTIASAPVGPGGRRFANAAAIVATPLDPPALLMRLKAIEHDFGRRGGRRWGARVLDIDILLWSGGAWRSRRLVIPHPRLAARRFVLDPLAPIAGDWRLPGMGLRVRHLARRLTGSRPIHRAGAGRVRSSVGRASDF